MMPAMVCCSLLDWAKASNLHWQLQPSMKDTMPKSLEVAVMRQLCCVSYSWVRQRMLVVE